MSLSVTPILTTMPFPPAAMPREHAAFRLVTTPAIRCIAPPQSRSDQDLMKASRSALSRPAWVRYRPCAALPYSWYCAVGTSAAVRHPVISTGALAVQGLQQDGQVTGQRVVVIAAAWRIRPAVPAPIVPGTPQARLHQRVELVLPHLTVQQPGVRENDRLATTPVLVVQPRAVSCREDTTSSTPWLSLGAFRTC